MGPVLIVTMHMGNWELGMWPITLAGVRPAGVYRLVKNPYVDRYLRAQRKELYPGGLFGRGRAAGQDEGQKTARLIMDYVRQGGRLGFISDLYDAQGHRGAVLRLSRQEHADRGDDRAAGRRAHLDRPLLAHRQPRLLRRQCQRAQDPAHEPIRPRTSAHHRGDPAPFRNLDPRDSRTVHVVEPSLVLAHQPGLDHSFECIVGDGLKRICGKIMPK